MSTALLAAGDPLLSGRVDGGVVLIVLLKAGVAFGALLTAVIVMIWFERKLVADMQNRIGPNRAGPWGLFQTVADAIKLYAKENFVPAKADRRIYHLAPVLSVVPAFLAFTIVPVGGAFTLSGHRTHLQVADPPIGVLFLLAVSSVAVYGVMLAGWSSGSKYPLLGSVRASAQMVSYEAALGLSTAAVVLVTGSLLTSEIVADQADSIIDWNVFRLGFVPFFIFVIAATAELHRPPFDLVEAEQELVGGFHTEYSAMRFGLFYLAEFMNTITMSAIIVTLFLGGPSGPGPHDGFPGALVPVAWFLGKVIVFLFAYVWVRATLPRYRYDQLMDLGWKRMIPLALVWLLVLAGMIVERSYGFAVFGGAIVVGALLLRAMQLGHEVTEAEMGEVR